MAVTRRARRARRPVLRAAVLRRPRAGVRRIATSKRPGRQAETAAVRLELPLKSRVVARLKARVRVVAPQVPAGALQTARPTPAQVAPVAGASPYAFLGRLRDRRRPKIGRFLNPDQLEKGVEQPSQERHAREPPVTPSVLVSEQEPRPDEPPEERPQEPLEHARISVVASALLWRSAGQLASEGTDVDRAPE